MDENFDPKDPDWWKGDKTPSKSDLPKVLEEMKQRLLQDAQARQAELARLQEEAENLAKEFEERQKIEAKSFLRGQLVLKILFCILIAVTIATGVLGWISGSNREAARNQLILEALEYEKEHPQGK